MQKTCANGWCKQTFEVTDGDLAFYEAVSPTIDELRIPLPPPTKCPACRYQQRLTWRIERNLYRRTSQATGKDIVSIFSADKAWPPVYEQDYWWSDKWNATDYGRDVDLGRPFFEQWAELFRVVPQIAMNNQMSENCAYTNQSQRNKDCYMIFCSNDSRDCLHGMWQQKCRNCLDTVYLENGELCYEVLNGENCYRCTFSQNLDNCADVHFSKNCTGCKNCIGCINLRNKEHHLFNEPCSPEEFEHVRASFDSATTVAELRERAAAFFEKHPAKYYVGANIESSSGDYLRNVREVHDSFNCRRGEYFHHCQDVWRAQHVQDLTETAENSFCYSIEGIVTNVNALFCKKSCDLSEAIYCSHCNFSKNLFGCVSMNHKQYGILNKQYTKEDYNALVPRIIEAMRSRGEWGEHFPPEFSPFGYNETVAQEYFPLTKEQALARGFRWTDYEPLAPDVERFVEAAQLPDRIDDVPDDIVQWAIRCEATGKPFRIIKQELDFYRTMRLPIPRLHHDERYRRRMALRNPRKLWDRACATCRKAIRTTFAPERPEKVLCEECYLSAVY